MSGELGTTKQDSVVVTWAQFGEACQDLTGQVLRSGFMPEVVVAIARGGLLPGGAIAYALGVELVDVINVERLDEFGSPIPDPGLLAPHVDSAAIAGRRLLIVDDLTDTGRTLGVVTRLLRGFGAQLRSAVLFSKPNTVFPADHVWRQARGWVEFPWNVGNLE